MADGGKGDKRRKGADDAKYSSGWENIWGTGDSGGTERNSNGGSFDSDAERTDTEGNLPQTGR